MENCEVKFAQESNLKKHILESHEEPKTKSRLKVKKSKHSAKIAKKKKPSRKREKKQVQQQTSLKLPSMEFVFSSIQPNEEAEEEEWIIEEPARKCCHKIISYIILLL